MHTRLTPAPVSHGRHADALQGLRNLAADNLCAHWEAGTQATSYRVCIALRPRPGWCVASGLNCIGAEGKRMRGCMIAWAVEYRKAEAGLALRSGGAAVG